MPPASGAGVTSTPLCTLWGLTLKGTPPDQRVLVRDRWTGDLRRHRRVPRRLARDLDARVGELVAAHDPAQADPREFLGARFDAGLAWVSFPRGLGGLEVGPQWQKRVNTRLAAEGAPNAFMQNPLGYGMGGPTLLAHTS